jgi:DNA polymerase I-like protein with 3'-5' exonuclease and polymerase domains
MDTPLGRRRFFNDRLYSDHTRRKAIAYGPQSLVADIISKGLIKVYAQLEPEVWVHAMIHDALVVSMEEAKFDSLLPRVLDLMTVEVEVNSRSMIIPVDAEIGHNWGKYKAPLTSEDGTVYHGNILGLKKYA